MSSKITLRQWLQGALDAIRGSNIISSGLETATSPDFLESSLKIALSLTQQIIKMEDWTDVGFLSVADLSSFVYVTVPHKADAVTITVPSIGITTAELADGDKDSFLTPPSFTSGANENILLDGNQEEHEIFDSFITNAKYSIVDEQDCLSLSSPNSLGDLVDLAPLDESDHLDKIFERTEEANMKDRRLSREKSVSASVESENTAVTPNLDYFATEYAELRFYNDPVDVTRHYHCAQTSLDRIHCLGLLFYELFSGGQIPPPEFVIASHSKDKSSMRINTLNLSESDDNFRPNPKIRFSQANKRRPSLCEVTVEYLRLMGLPRALCDLIYNMIISVYDDLSGNDSYSHMSDVMEDLKLMLEKPSKFLQDVDATKIFSTGLLMGDTMFVREEEFTSLCDSYCRFTSRKSEFAVISGMAGAGKSCLANRLGTYITANRGLFLSGKFDQQKKFKPFSALASAFNDYFVRFNTGEQPVLRKSMPRMLQLFMGQDLRYLIKIIPALGLILEHDDHIHEATADQDCVNGQNRIVYLFCRFIEFLSSFLNAPITLFLDDIQWSDPASVSVISQLLKTSRRSRFFFFGCCRDYENFAENLLWKDMKDCVIHFGIRSTIVELGRLNENSVREIISDLLCLSPRLVAGLSRVVYHKTNGNLLLISQLLQTLTRDSTIRFDLGRRRWEWDEDKIQSRELPEDLAIYFARSINKLPADVQKALCLLSCFGASTKCGLIQVLESKLGFNIADGLDVAVNEGLVKLFNRRYNFSHDRIQEAAYGMMKDEDRCLYHLEYGRTLVNLSTETGDDELLFIAVDQINLAGSAAISDATGAAEMAHFNLLAGKKAVEMSDFTAAYAHFDNGISFLKKNHWKDHYHLSLQLFESAAQCSLVLGDALSLTILSDQVSVNAISFVDTLNTMLVVMTSLEHLSKNNESVNMGLSILSNLGHPIPMLYSEADINCEIQDMLSELSNTPDHDIMNFNIMTDSTLKMTMKFLARMQFSVFQVNPALQPIITLKMIRLTVTHGISPVSPVAFASFAGLLAMIGKLKEAHRFTKLAKALQNKVGSKEFVGQIMVMTSEILSFFEPSLSVNDFFIKGAESAIAAGDVHWACFNRISSCAIMFWAGVNLHQLKKTLSETCRFIIEQDHLNALCHLIPCKDSISILIGDENDDPFDDRLETFVRSHSQIMMLQFLKIYSSFMFNNFDDLKKAAEDYFMNITKTWFLYSFYETWAFIGGLVSFRIYRKTRDCSWAVRGGQFKSMMLSWATHGSKWNFEHKSMLLEAEEYFSNGDFCNAQVSYDSAITSAKAHKNLSNEALAWELAGNFLLDIGNKAKAVDYFLSAHEKYQEWGAYAKATALYNSVFDQF